MAAIPESVARATALCVGPHPRPDTALLEATLAGLRGRPRRLSPVWFYDEAGSLLFDRICELPEYYLTRTETAILARHAPQIAQAAGPGVCVVEPGSGTSAKTQLLLDALERPVAYVPIDVAADHLAAAAQQLRVRHPALQVRPVCADFTRPFALPPGTPGTRRLVFFPGSTLGNFAPPDAIALLGQLRRLAGPDGRMLVGIDLRKAPSRLLPAYDDAAGVTAAFNLNALRHLNRVLGGSFDPDAFQHRAVWSERHSRIEMHLVSRRRQIVLLGGEALRFAAGEPIVSEYSHKYSLPGFAALARHAGWSVTRVWTDPGADFSVQWLQPAVPVAGGRRGARGGLRPIHNPLRDGGVAAP